MRGSSRFCTCRAGWWGLCRAHLWGTALHPSYLACLTFQAQPVISAVAGSSFRSDFVTPSASWEFSSVWVHSGNVWWGSWCDTLPCTRRTWLSCASSSLSVSRPSSWADCPSLASLLIQWRLSHSEDLLQTHSSRREQHLMKNLSPFSWQLSSLNP